MNTKSLSLLFTFYFSLFALFAFSQNIVSNNENVPPDSILLNNGKYIVCRVTDTTGFRIETKKYHSGSNKRRFVDKENIFSIKYGATHHETVYYIYDTLIGNVMTVDETRLFIAGEQDARRGYHAFPTSAGSFVLCTSAGVITTIFSVALPFAYAGFMSYDYVKVNHKSVRNLNNVKQNAYLVGYAHVAKKKRIIRAFIWGGVGVIVGNIIHFDVFHDD